MARYLIAPIAGVVYFGAIAGLGYIVAHSGAAGLLGACALAGIVLALTPSK